MRNTTASAVSSPVRLQAVLTAPSLLLTPHIAGGTQESLLRMSLQSAEAMLRILQGQRPDSLVNPSVWDQHLTRLGAGT